MDLLTVARQNSPFVRLLGVKFLTADLDRLTAELEVREDLCTTPAIAHGGVLMAFADSLGATATIINLPDGKSTTTLESKTNFFAPAPVGSTVTGECTPLHRGRRTMVWQTRITNADGRLLALVTQTQMVLDAG
ncbi:MAG TPA: PaaI family thioesterase [Dehalococcoidia bacterium]